MRDRLIELLEAYPCMSTAEDFFMESISSDLADYLLANGVIVPPCKVGDTVYVRTSDSPTGIEETIVSEIKIKIKENNKISYRISAPCIYDEWGDAHWTFCAFDFGKTVFLTKGEAERALKGDKDINVLCKTEKGGEGK